MCYNEGVKNRGVHTTFLKKENLKMSGNLRHIENAERLQRFSGIENNNINEEPKNEEPLIYDESKCSGFTMAAVGSALLMFVGIIIYALVI